MRIIGGTAKKKKLLSRTDVVRPTSDIIKETLFNLLGDLEGSYFLDLYAGTGNVGIEALSRGAASVIFVEKSYELCRIIHKNLKITDFVQRGKVVKKEVKKSIFKSFLNKCLIFDVIFADPPYEKGIVKHLLKCFDFNLLAKDGLFVIQHSTREYPKIKSTKAVTVGDSVLSVFEKAKL
jgi:16S rRNA (guanine966-N2)-methyltransferase